MRREVVLILIIAASALNMQAQDAPVKTVNIDPPPAKGDSATQPLVISAPEFDPSPCHPKEKTAFNVLVSLTVDTKGKPQNLAVATSSGDACVDAAALKTAKRYRFTPAKRDGKPIEFMMR